MIWKKESQAEAIREHSESKDCRFWQSGKGGDRIGGRRLFGSYWRGNHAKRFYGRKTTAGIFEADADIN